MRNLEFNLNALRVFLPRDCYGPWNNRFTANNTTQLMHGGFTAKRFLSFTILTSRAMAKRKAPSPSPSGSGSDNISVAIPQRNVRQKLLHFAPRPSPASTSFRTVDFVSIPHGEQPSQDELSIAVEDTQKPYFDRPLIIDGKRPRTQTSQRRTLRELWGLAQPSGENSSLSFTSTAS